MATDYKKNAAEAKKVVASLPKAQRAAAQKVIAQAAKTGEGVSNNELAFFKANSSKLSDKTDPKQFLGTLEQRQTFLQSQQGTGTGTGTQISEEEAARRAAQEIENARLQAQRTDWVEYTTQLFNNYGLGSLAPKITEFIQMGYSPDTVTLKLQETPEYKQRFSGNETRRKAGLPVLSPAEYLSTESAYRESMRAANLPKGFYDDPSDFSNFIANDVSPSELKSRVDAAALSINNADPYYTSSLARLYGIGTGDMVAYALDPERALPLINKQVQAAQFAAEGARQGFKTPAALAETYTGMGVSQAQARQGFEQVAQILPEAQKLSQISSGTTAPVGFAEVTSAVLGGEQSAEYKRRLQRLAEMEQSRFAGQAGVGRGSLAKPNSGQF